MRAVPVTHTALPAETSSVREARRFTAGALERWHREDLEFAATQAVTELVTNAVLHARTVVAVRLRLEHGVLRIEVSDGSSRVPTRRAYSAHATTGRGLLVLERVSRAWGVDQTSTGKVVWCEVVEDGPEIDLDAFDDELDVPAHPGGCSSPGGTRAWAA